MGRTSPGTDNESLQELRDDLKDLSKTIKLEIKSNENLSRVFLIFAFIQIVIAVFQFGFDIVASGSALLQVIGVVFFFVCMFCMYKLFESLPGSRK